jgi:uncharacterized protein (DUF58 family)
VTIASTATEPYAWSQRGEAASLALPPLLVRAERVAATMILGVHGRKRAGPGESFWQFRPYAFGDSTQRIDWRRSAISDRVFIKENEWETANTLWVWASPTSRMNFKSKPQGETKRDRAIVLSLAMASLAIRAHERVGGLGSPRQPGYGKSTLYRIAEWLISKRSDDLPTPARLQKQSAAILISDFLEPIEQLSKTLAPLADLGISGHLVQVYDPIEETFPFEGRIEFVGLDKPLNYLAPKTQDIKTAYLEKYRAHNDNVRTLASKLGWSVLRHSTDQPISPALVALFERVSGGRLQRGGTG